MGFGVIFIGYAFTYLMTLNSYGFLFRIIGIAVMLYGARKLCAFETRFKTVYALMILLAALSCGETLTAIFADYIEPAPAFLSENTKNIFYAAFMAFSALLHFFFYRATRKLSHDIGNIKIYGKTVRYEIYVAVEVILALSTLISYFLRLKIVNALFAASFIVFYIIVFLNLALIYSCYKNICEEGDEDAPRKASRFAFMEKLFRASEKKEAEIYNKTKEYAENRLRQEQTAKALKKRKKKK